MPKYLVDEWNSLDLREVMAAKGSMLIGTGLDHPNELSALPVTGVDGAVLAEDSSQARGVGYVRGLMLTLPLHHILQASLTDTNSPAASQFLLNSHRGVQCVPLSTTFTQVRLCVNKQGTAGAASYKLTLKYASSFSTSAASYSDIGTSAVEVACNVADTVIDSGWVDLAAGAKIDPCYIALLSSGGDGVLDPSFGSMVAYFRR